MKKQLILSAITLCLAGSVFADPSPVLSQQLKMDTLKKKISELKQNIDNNTDKHETLMEELSKTESQIGLLNVSLQRVDKRLSDLPKEIKSLKQRITFNEKKMKQQQTVFAKQIRQAYMAGQQDFLKLLLQEESPEKISRLMAYHRALSKERRDLIVSIDDRTKTLAQDKAKIHKEIGDLEQLKAAQTNQQLALYTSKKYRQEIIKHIQKEIHSHRTQLAQLKEDKKQLAQVIARLERTHRWDRHPRQPFSKMKGQLPVPTIGRVNKQFGDHVLNSPITYNGLFISAKQGADIKAIYPGNVVFADWLRGFGLMMIIDHGDGYMSLYAHNESLYKHAGETVEANELIAKVGHTGGQSKPGLYFEIRHNGQAVNPARWVNSLV